MSHAIVVDTTFKKINEYCGRIYCCCNKPHEGLLIRHVTVDSNGILEPENQVGNSITRPRFDEVPVNFITGKVLYTALQPISVEVKLLEFERIPKAR